MKGTKDIATFLPVDGVLDKIYAKGDSDWACDDLDRRSLGGGVVAVGGCRMHTHSRSLSPHALSSGEAEIMETIEVLKEAMLLQHTLMFIGLGTLPIEVSVDASVARQFVFKKGVGKMKHLELRQLWLQDLHERGIFSIRKIPRTETKLMFLPILQVQRNLYRFVKS
jgi:hypothetical protein